MKYNSLNEASNIRLELLKTLKYSSIEHHSVIELINDTDLLYDYIQNGKFEAKKCSYPEKEVDVDTWGYTGEEYEDYKDEVVSEKDAACELVDIDPWNTEEFFKLCNSFKNDLNVFQCSTASTDFSKEENRKNFYEGIFAKDTDVDQIKEHLTPTRLVNYAHTPTNEEIEEKFKSIKSLPEKPFQLASIYENMCKEYIKNNTPLTKKESFFDQWSKERDEKLAKEKEKDRRNLELREIAASFTFKEDF